MLLVFAGLAQAATLTEGFLVTAGGSLPNLNLLDARTSTDNIQAVPQLRLLLDAHSWSVTRKRLLDVNFGLSYDGYHGVAIHLGVGPGSRRVISNFYLENANGLMFGQGATLSWLCGASLRLVVTNPAQLFTLSLEPHAGFGLEYDPTYTWLTSSFGLTVNLGFQTHPD